MKTKVFKFLSLGLFFFFFLESCSLFTEDPGFVIHSKGYVTEKVQIFFTNPGTRRGEEIDNGIEKFIIKLINTAEKSIDIAIYQLSLESLIEALAESSRRGIQVRIVGDFEEKNSYGYHFLREMGLDIHSGNTNGIQHNKFIIIDNEKLFTGTGNFTETGIYRNNNIFLYLENSEISHCFTQEFEAMFRGYFGKDKIEISLEKSESQKSKKYIINGSEYSVYFSPQDGKNAIRAISDLVFTAQESIYYMIFAFTHDELASSLIYVSREKGISVYGIHDSGFISSTGSEASRLYSAGFSDKYQQYSNGPFIREDGNENYLDPSSNLHGGKMHAKVLFIDPGTETAALAIGSFNWSENAVSLNDENLLLIKDPFLVDFIWDYFQNAWSVSHDLANKGILPSGSSSVHEEKDIIISEIGVRGIKKDGPSGENGAYQKNNLYVELFNRSGKAIDLTHWSLAWGSEKFSKFPFEKTFPFPGKANAYTKSLRSCEKGNPQWNLICPKDYKLIYIQEDALYFSFSEENDNLETSPHIKIPSSKNFQPVDEGWVFLYLLDKRMETVDQVVLNLDAYEDIPEVITSYYRVDYKNNIPSEGYLKESWLSAPQGSGIVYFSYDSFGKYIASLPGNDWNDNGIYDYTWGSPGYDNDVNFLEEND